MRRSGFALANRSLSTYRAAVYKTNGAPRDVVEIVEKEIESMTDDSVRVQFLASPINPADINQIEGVYPVKPALPAIGGNEGVAEVVEVGSNISRFKIGDWVIPAMSGFGTWRSEAICSENELSRIPSNLSLESAATIAVNPATAYRMLQDFVRLEPGDVVVQNAANSAVGRATIQLAKHFQLRTINVVRDREPDKLESLKSELLSLGADVVVTDTLATSREFSDVLKEFPLPKLGLNAVGGKNATAIARALEESGTMVSYGGMSRKPVMIPTGLFIFKDIRLRGFWLTRWTSSVSIEAREEMLQTLADLSLKGVLVPKVQIVNLTDIDSALKLQSTSFRDTKPLLNLQQ